MNNELDPDEFHESQHTPEEICDHYNACKYTPDTVPTDTEHLPASKDHAEAWLPMAEPATDKKIYWSNTEAKWEPWPE